MAFRGTRDSQACMYVMHQTPWSLKRNRYRRSCNMFELLVRRTLLITLVHYLVLLKRSQIGPQKQSFSRIYGSSLPTSLTCVCLTLQRLRTLETGCGDNECKIVMNVMIQMLYLKRSVNMVTNSYAKNIEHIYLVSYWGYINLMLVLHNCEIYILIKIKGLESHVYFSSFIIIFV